MSSLHPTRRQLLQYTGAGLTGLGAQLALGRLGHASSGIGGFPNHPPTAKRVVVLYMLGGLSQFELYDDKPLLRERHGEDLPKSLLETGQVTTVTERQGAFPVVGANSTFTQCGESGQELSQFQPALHRHADRLCIVRTMQTDSVVHERANVAFFSGTTLLGRPSMGSWVSYGLGSENRDLPEFVVMTSGRGDASGLNARFWGSGFLPGHHQGVQFRSASDPVLFLGNPEGVGEKARASVYRGLGELNGIEAEATGDPGVRTRIKAFEKAARMQLAVPELTDLKSESDEVLERYGAKRDEPSFARNCLLARRLLERDVRFVQVLDRGWDHHQGMPRAMERKCGETDKPIGALLDDLVNTGMLDDTLVVFAGEFGRTPYCEGRFTPRSYGRDHNNRVGALWMAGGGIRGGVTYGATDEWGWDTVEDPFHVNDLQATVLHCLGVDHLKLTYRDQGRDHRLTDVAGKVPAELLA